MLAFALALSLLSGLLFGLAAGCQVCRTEVFKTTFRNVARRQRHDEPESRTPSAAEHVGRDTGGAGGRCLLCRPRLPMIRTFAALRNVQPGFVRPEKVQMLRLSIPEAQVPEPERVVRMQHDIVERIASIPGVTSVTFSTAMPMEMEFENNMVVTAEDKTYGEGIPPLRRSKSVAPDLFRYALGTPIIAGRDFSWTDIHDNREVVVVSESLARELWGGPPAALGKRLRVGRAGKLNEIVGVVGDVHDSGVQEQAPGNRALAGRSTARSRNSFGLRSPLGHVRDSKRARRDRRSRQADWSRGLGGQPEPSARCGADARRCLRPFDGANLVHSRVARHCRVHGTRARSCRHLRRDFVRCLDGDEKSASGWRSGHNKARFDARFVCHGLALAAHRLWSSGSVIAMGLTRLMSSLLFDISPLDPLTFTSVPLVLAMAAAFCQLCSQCGVRAALDPLEALKACWVDDLALQPFTLL